MLDKMRRVTESDLFGFQSEMKYNVQEIKVQKNQQEYGQKKFIKP
tara:strand:- start:172 stop:306 length:135 start_codon:yes stop_codon:yes gene_type:complete